MTLLTKEVGSVLRFTAIALVGAFLVSGCSGGGLQTTPIAPASPGSLSTATGLPASKIITSKRPIRKRLLVLCNDGTYADVCVGGGAIGGGGGSSWSGGDVSQVDAGGGGGAYRPTPDPTPYDPCADPTSLECVSNGQQVACTGTPSQCNGVICAGSPYAIDGSVPSVTPGSSYGGQLGYTRIADMNAIYSGVTNIGWLYKGDDGVIYIQVNYASGYTLGGSVAVGFSFIVQGSVGGGVNSPSGYSGVMKFSGNLGASHASPGKCASGGSVLV